jgi:hypothetical protein
MPPASPILSDIGYESDASLTGTGPQLQTQGFENFKNVNTNISNNRNNRNNSNEINYKNLVNTADGNKAILTNKTQFLLPEITSQKRSAADYSGIDWHAGFSGNKDNLYTTPQSLTNIIERMWLERGGLDQNQIIKQSREPWTKNTYSTGLKGPTNINGKEQIPTCEKIRQPYNTKYPFGIPINSNTGEPLNERESVHFNSTDITSLGISSPLLNQNMNMDFNSTPIYSNGGCNKISFLNDNKICSSNNNF